MYTIDLWVSLLPFRVQSAQTLSNIPQASHDTAGWRLSVIVCARWLWLHNAMAAGKSVQTYVFFVTGALQNAAAVHLPSSHNLA